MRDPDWMWEVRRAVMRYGRLSRARSVRSSFQQKPEPARCTRSRMWAGQVGEAVGPEGYGVVDRKGGCRGRNQSCITSLASSYQRSFVSIRCLAIAEP